MGIEYFSWSSIQMDELRQRFDEVLGHDYSEFDKEIEDEPDDGGDRAITADYRSKVRKRVASWCNHFEVPYDAVRNYDRSTWAPAGVQSWNLHIDYESIVNQIINSLVTVQADSSKIYRPKIFETANVEIMAWLRSRPGDVDRVHHRSFEAIVAEVVKDKGWHVELTKQTQDGGYDILALRTDAPGFTIKLIVECKLYNIEHSVGAPMVDRLVGVAVREHADMSMLVTNSRFTSVAWERWEEYVGRNLLLVDRTEFFEWLREYHG